MKKLLIMSLAVLSLAACNMKPTQSASTGNTAAPAAPNFVLPNVNGQQWDFRATQADKPVFVAFMATFCGFCKKMAPYVEEMAGKYNAKGAEFVIVFVDEAADAPSEFVKAYNIKDAKVLYNGGAFAQEVGVRGFPHMFLFDNKSDVVSQWSGFNPEYVTPITAQLDDMLARK